MDARRSKETWQAVRARYTWHMNPPFKDEFDRSHWWKDQPDVEPVAALYELTRRHPQVGQLRFSLRHASWYGQELRAPLAGAAKQRMVTQACNDIGQQPAAIHCLCLIGLKSWPKLTPEDQDYWDQTADGIKGLDCGGDLMQCGSVTMSALADIFLNTTATF